MASRPAQLLREGGQARGRGTGRGKAAILTEGSGQEKASRWAEDEAPAILSKTGLGANLSVK